MSFSVNQDPKNSPASESSSKKTAPNALSPEEILAQPDSSAGSEQKKSDPLAALRAKMTKNADSGNTPTNGQMPSVPEKEKPTAEPGKTLLQRCRPYIIDDNGRDTSVPQKPVYELEPVADILKTGEKETDIETIAKKYGISLDIQPPKKVPPKPVLPADRNTTPIPVTPNPVSPLSEKTVILPKTAAPAAVPKQEIFAEILNGLHENEQEPLPDLSDIDNEVQPKAEKSEPVASDTATIRFTPIKEGGNDDGKIRVSASTQTIDLTGEFAELEPIQTPSAEKINLEESEFDSYQAAEEYENEADAKRLIRKFSVKKRNSFLRLGGTVVFCLALLAFLLPPLNDTLMSHPKTGMTVCTSFLAAALLCNADLFAKFRFFFGKRCPADVFAGLAGLTVIAFGVLCAQKNINHYEMILLGGLILLSRAICNFIGISAMLGNLKQVTSKRPQKAVSLLEDEATTFAMAKDAVDGDALIAVPRRTKQLSGFMKYATFSAPLDGKMRIIAVFAVLFAVICGFAGFSYYRDPVVGVYAAAVVLCMAAIPTAFMIDHLPLGGAAAKLNRKGAMIAGLAAADRIDQSNATVLSAKEIFPDDTVTLIDMKVLKENNFDETILRAASLTEAVGSPLAPIFKRIAKTNQSYTVPDSDTVKYEDRLGLSGWVGEELLFIGNRTLMQAHGIDVPDVEVDRKILRKGYFPVYLASGGKACALLIIQYEADPDVVSELRRLTGMGVTLLVDSCDPNLTEEMICDYLGLYSDSVKVMSSAGAHLYRNAAAPVPAVVAPASFRGNPLDLIRIINTASRIKRSNLLLTVMYIIAAVFGTVLFAYLMFSGSDLPPAGRTVLLYELIATAVSVLFYLFRKP